MKHIAVIGVGYVGLVTSACLADLGNDVVALDVDTKRIANLKKGRLPIYEPGLGEIVNRNFSAKRLHFTNQYKQALKKAEIVFIAVGTPEKSTGEADLQYVEAAAKEIGKHMQPGTIIVNKSTVPVGTGDFVQSVINKSLTNKKAFQVVSCPEFLKEGSAVSDFSNPDRIVLGSADKLAAEKVAQLFLPLRAPIIVTDIRTSEMIKYASNAFLATKISFINEIANICEELGADVNEVAVGMGYDRRIGAAFLNAGLGWGGSCFPKDVKALAHMAHATEDAVHILDATIAVNDMRIDRVVERLRDMVKGGLKGKKVGFLGLAFKPDTDDIREAASVKLYDKLILEGAKIYGYDPVAAHNAKSQAKKLILRKDAYKLVTDMDAVVVVTEWNEFKELDLVKVKKLMKSAVIFDARNIYNPARMKSLGFVYKSIGR